MARGLVQTKNRAECEVELRLGKVEREEEFWPLPGLGGSGQAQQQYWLEDGTKSKEVFLKNLIPRPRMNYFKNLSRSVCLSILAGIFSCVTNGSEEANLEKSPTRV